jgi:protein involved in polysaccharide export with SLBB domain
MLRRSLNLTAQLVGICLLAFSIGCESTGSATARTNPKIPEAASSALLRPGDSLGIALQGIPDPTMHNVQIDDQGLISLPYIGAITVARLTASDLSTHIRETYIARDYYKTINVSVTVTERFVYVGGEVQRPGRITWTPDLTMAKAIQAAGGFTLYAKENAVSVVRDQAAYTLDAKLAQRAPSEDPRLLPGDSIQVDRSAF